jgi:hypothetical protein
MESCNEGEFGTAVHELRLPVDHQLSEPLKLRIISLRMHVEIQVL